MPQSSLASVATWLGRVSRLSPLYESVEVLVMSKATGTPSTSTGSSAWSFGVTARMPSAIARESQKAGVRRALWLRQRRIDERPEDGRLIAEQLLFDLHRVRVDDQVQGGRLGRSKAAQLIIRVEDHRVVGGEDGHPGIEIIQACRIAARVLKQRAQDAQPARAVGLVLVRQPLVLPATGRAPHGGGVDQDQLIAFAAGRIIVVRESDRLERARRMADFGRVSEALKARVGERIAFFGAEWAVRIVG